jgi:hypothetical protein
VMPPALSTHATSGITGYSFVMFLVAECPLLKS